MLWCGKPSSIEYRTRDHRQPMIGSSLGGEYYSVYGAYKEQGGFVWELFSSANWLRHLSAFGRATCRQVDANVFIMWGLRKLMILIDTDGW